MLVDGDSVRPQAPKGAEHWCRVFHETLETLFDYVPQATKATLRDRYWKEPKDQTTAHPSALSALLSRWEQHSRPVWNPQDWPWRTGQDGQLYKPAPQGLYLTRYRNRETERVRSCARRGQILRISALMIFRRCHSRRDQMCWMRAGVWGVKTLHLNDTGNC